MFRVFRIFDKDENLKLSFDEFYNGIQKYGLDVSEKEAKESFDYIDKDKSGSINIDEFLNALMV